MSSITKAVIFWIVMAISAVLLWRVLQTGQFNWRSALFSVIFSVLVFWAFRITITLIRH